MIRPAMPSVVRVLPRKAVQMQKPRTVEQLLEFLKRSPVVLYSGPVPEARKEVARERLVFRRSAEFGVYFTTPGGSERYIPLPGAGKPLSIEFLESGFKLTTRHAVAELRFEYANEAGR